MTKKEEHNNEKNCSRRKMTKFVDNLKYPYIIRIIKSKKDENEVR